MTTPSSDEPGLQADQNLLDRAWVRIGAGTAIAAQAMVFSLSVNLSEIDGWAYIIVHGLLILATFATLIFLGGELVRSTWDALRERRVSIDLLFLVTLLGALIGSLVSTFTRAGSVYYEVVAILIVVHSTGKMLGARSRASALRVVADLRKDFDRCEVRQRSRTASAVGPSLVDGPVVVGDAKDGPPTSGGPTGEAWIERETASVSVGQDVRVRPGRTIPVDGEIVSGRGFVQEATLTGEWAPVSRGPGERVLAGTVAVDAELIVRRTSTTRQIDGILNEVERARIAPSRLQEQADRLIRWFLPLVVGASAATFGVWWWLGPWQQALFNAMAVLLVACPCAMGLATPVAIWGGLAKLAHGGLSARSGDFIDVLARADVVCLDKTGTLSTERMQVKSWRIECAWETRASWLKQAVAALEGKFDHPIAQAVAASGSEVGRGLRSAPDSVMAERPGAESRPYRSETFNISDARVIAGLGVIGRVRGENGETCELAVGDARLGSEGRSVLARDSEGDVARAQERSSRASTLLHAEDARCVFVFVDGQHAATIELGETWRAGMESALGELRELGVTVEILTGDAQAPRELAGVPVRAGLTPEQKLSAVRAQVAAGRTVLFVGDGVNDAGAMTAAAGAVALRGGSDLARAAAMAVFAGEDLRFLPWSIRLARKVRGSVRGNLVFAAVYNVIGMALAATGTLHPVAAVLLMVVSSFAVSARALRSAKVAGI